LTEARHGRQLLEGGARRLGDDPGECRLARSLAARSRIAEPTRSSGDREPQRRVLAEHLFLADELVQAARPQAQASGATSCIRSRAASAKRSLTPEVCSCDGYGRGEDYSQPILSGEGQSDYERYLRTDELLALQKSPAEQADRDELLFQTVHQASELWLKLAWSEAEEATRLIEAGELQGAQRLLRRSVLALDYVIAQLEMLEALSPWEYQAIRKVLGHGSGFDSPGFRQIRRVTPPLGQAFSQQLREAGLNVVSLYVEGREHEDLYQLAELLLSWDERIGLWRMRHYLVVARVIGDQVVGTQGTPVELLPGLIKQRFYPELWQARNRLTELANEEA
jgi:tryptophan 2,3-dioxygenase